MRKRKSRWPVQTTEFRMGQAIVKDDVSHACQMLDLGADVNGAGDGATWLHCAVEWGSIECARLLIERGANLEAKDQFGETPLRRAVETSGTYQIASPLVARLLIERGADVNAISGNDGENVLQAALHSCKADAEDKELIDLLRNVGACV